jgi:hypothetical protein
MNKKNSEVSFRVCEDFDNRVMLEQRAESNDGGIVRWIMLDSSEAITLGKRLIAVGKSAAAAAMHKCKKC